MSVPKYYMGQKAFNLLLDRINEDALNVAQYKIKPTLIKRKTTR
jgi:DNA-binding LacI/PurR family transcriptional regulator